MNNKLSAVGLLAALILTGCGSSPAATSPATSVASTDTMPSSSASSSSAPSAVLPTPTLQRNERGQLPKKLGETAAIVGEDGEWRLEFVVTEFEFVKCSEYSGALNGHALAAHIDVKTSGDFEGPLEINGIPGLISFGAYDWRGYEPDGTRMNELNSVAIQNCFESQSKLLPDSIGKGEKAKGMVLLDVMTKTGEVAFDPYGDGGWIWEYPGMKANA